MNFSKSTNNTHIHSQYDVNTRKPSKQIVETKNNNFYSYTYSLFSIAAERWHNVNLSILYDDYEIAVDCFIEALVFLDTVQCVETLWQD